MGSLVHLKLAAGIVASFADLGLALLVSGALAKVAELYSPIVPQASPGLFLWPCSVERERECQEGAWLLKTQKWPQGVRVAWLSGCLQLRS